MKTREIIAVYCRVTSDCYLLHAATGHDYTHSDRYWPDYYSDEFGDDELETVCVDVPSELADDLCKQGGSQQVFPDGYEAWQAALVHFLDAEAEAVEDVL